MTTDDNSQSTQPWKRAAQDPMVYFTLALVVVGFLQWNVLSKTDETLRVQQRAWIEPIGGNLILSPTKDKGIAYSVTLVNSGKEPASDVHIVTQNSVIDSYEPEFTNMYDVTVPENTSCSAEPSKKGLSIIPPNANGLAISYAENTLHGTPPTVADQRIIDGTKFFVLQGCITYKTQGQTKKSSYCYVLQSSMQIATQPSFQVIVRPGDFASSPTNASANPQPKSNQTPQRVYNFATCSTGFVIE